MHSSTFDYLKPTDAQIEQMKVVREAAKVYCDVIEANLPDGPDKTYMIRAHRSNAMWANIAITRQPDGSPRCVMQPFTSKTSPSPLRRCLASLDSKHISTTSRTSSTKKSADIGGRT